MLSSHSPVIMARRRPGLLQANEFLLEKEKEELSPHFLLMEDEEGSWPSPEQSWKGDKRDQAKKVRSSTKG